ncbi:metal-sensitive transcriptional regulator [Crassaminicella indica]|uniref:Metal-sensitive transcriptional regulator n=1 Tax=Crassaminicella indica TaxID=2855394 RepID=A0ABX8REY3_9CLOT|nr:metal-sensitive transcriptional regulator [Crassaminicella indica]QXM06862.1 metal-sensitive transcriptional regulator [Crassaminicella indica]
MSTEDAKKDIINRLRTIKGHIAGIEKMVEDNTKTCDDILLQIAAIRASVHKVGLVILENYAKDCFINQKEGDYISKEEVEKVLKTIAKFVK